MFLLKGHRRLLRRLHGGWLRGGCGIRRRGIYIGGS